MNIAIDIGNSSAKVALLENGSVTKCMRIERLDVEFLADIFRQADKPIEQAVLSTVAGVEAEVENFLK